MECVACGEEMENPLNHHCDPAVEDRIEASRRASEAQLHKRRRLTEAQRMTLGFEILSLGEDDYDDDI